MIHPFCHYDLFLLFIIRRVHSFIIKNNGIINTVAEKNKKGNKILGVFLRDR